MKLNALIIIYIFCQAIVSAVHASPVDNDFLFFEYLELKKEKNGQATQKFVLRFNGPELDFLDVYFQQNGDAAIYQAKVENQRVAISSDKSSLFHLFAFGGYKNRRYVAQTNFILFGNSKVKVKKQPAILPNEPIQLIELVSPKFNYWPQTGQHFTFKLDTNFSANDVKVFVLENQHLKVLEPDKKMFFSYVPGHDKQLRAASKKAGRQDTIFARITNGKDLYKITYAMFLHRSRTAFLNQDLGVAAFLVSVLFFGIWIAMKRKRSKTPW